MNSIDFFHGLFAGVANFFQLQIAIGIVYDVDPLRRAVLRYDFNEVSRIMFALLFRPVLALNRYDTKRSSFSFRLTFRHQ